MDENVVGEGNCKRSYLTPVAKSDVIVTESQPSELDNAAEKYEADKCGHFSIRGYVAEVRRKDRKICWPFPTIGNHNKLEEQTLPPLHVPEFRWWHCQNCLRKNDAKETPIETGVVTNYFNRPCKTKTLALPGIPSTLSSGDVQKLHSGFQQSSEVNIVDGRKFSSDVSFRVNDDKNWPPLFGNKKEKGDEVVHPIMEDIHKLNDGISGKNLAICRSTYSLDKVDTCLAGVNFTKGGTFSTGFQIGNNGGGLSSSETAIATPSNSYEKRALETVTLKSKGYELVTNFSEIFQKETETLKSKCELVNNSKEIFHTEMPALSRTNLAQINAGNRDVLIPSVVSDVDKEVSNAVMGQTRKLHSLLSIDSSSESDENLAGEDVQDQHHASRRSNSGDTSHGSKPRKLCSLTDIIRREVLATSNKLDHTERDAKTDHMKTAGAQSKATPEASPGMSVYPVTNNQVAFQGTDKKVMLSKKKKCKLPQDQDGRSSRMSKQSGVTENIKILKEESEIKIMDTINANGELTGDASSQIGLHPGSKSFLGKHKNDKNLILGGEKKDMSQVEDILSSLAHHQDGSSNKVEIRKDAEIKCAGSELVPIKSFQDAIAGKDLNAGAQVYVAVEQNGKKLALGKKKNKVLQVEGEKSSIIPWQEGMSEKDLIMKRLQERRKNNGVLSDSLNSDGQAGMSQQDLIVKRLRERRKNNDVLSDSLNSDSQEGMSQQDWIVKRILERRKNNGVLSDSQDSKSQKDLIVKRLQERRKNNSVQSDSLNSSGQESMSQQDLIVKRLRERRKNNDVLSDSLNSDSQEGMSQLDRIVKRILERRKNNGVLSDSQDSMSQKDLIMKRLQERRKNNSVLSDSLNSDGQEGMSQQDLIVKRLRERRKNNDVLSDSLNSDGQEGMSQQDRIVKRLLERRKNNGVLSDSLNSDGQEGMSRRDRVVKRLRERRKNNDVLSDSLNSDSQEGMSPQDRIVKRLLESGKNNDVLSDSLNSDNQEGMSQKDLIVKRLLERRKNNSVLSDSLNSVQVSFTGKGVHHGLKCHLQTHRKATLNKRRKNLPQVECGVTIPGSESVSFPLICQPKDSSNACNYETAAVKEPSKLSMDQCDQMANNMCEQEASDDIPMEIVELMARNQYERRLYYARDATENRHCFSETSEKDKDTGLMDSTEAL